MTHANIVFFVVDFLLKVKSGDHGFAGYSFQLVPAAKARERERV